MTNAIATVQCVQCTTDLELPSEVEPGDIVTCRGCSQDHEVVEVAPVRVELAPEVEEDWGE